MEVIPLELLANPVQRKAIGVLCVHYTGAKRRLNDTVAQKTLWTVSSHDGLIILSGINRHMMNFNSINCRLYLYPYIDLIRKLFPAVGPEDSSRFFISQSMLDYFFRKVFQIGFAFAGPCGLLFQKDLFFCWFHDIKCFSQGFRFVEDHLKRHLSVNNRQLFRGTTIDPLYPWEYTGICIYAIRYIWKSIFQEI